MKRILNISWICMMCFVLLGTASCGSKVDKAELDKKIMESEKEPEFSDAEYEFMVDYLIDNYDKLDKMDVDDKEAEIAMAYSFILITAQMEGKLNQNVIKKFKKLQEKGEENVNSDEYKETQEALKKSLEEALAD